MSVEDVAIPVAAWRPRPGAFDDDRTATISGLSAPEGAIDVEYRIAFPFNLGASRHQRPVLVFGVTENWTFPAHYFSNGAVPSDINARDGFRLVVPSRWAMRGFVANGVDPGRVEVVPHGVDTEVFRFDVQKRDDMRRRLAVEGFVFLSVGSLVGTKGGVHLLDAFGILLERGIKATLLIKGHDELYQSQGRLQQLVGRMNDSRRRLVLKNMKYVGLSLDMFQMAALYSAADAYVSPYLAEGFNIPVLEAASVGLPIIATGGGATDDFTTDLFRRQLSARLDTSDGKTRLRPDVEHLAALMQEMAGDEAFVRQAWTAGPEHVANGYRWDDVAAKLVEVARRAS
ncbi:glycosyltransferase [Devosia sp. ZB163]|uniref:glycosyltransferase family 4 protein n=1 Tax=Devosia sp. ZB163 TaxID=3025938 RepID=UPI00235E0D03|nr:glycosyltransferase [Devosia sp. ZB163]MDC9825581.1 glycosyltransferase [Devosia sp. ZB163]